MSDYKAVARRYRPQVFADVVGQKAIVTTLVNAIRFKRLSHAYLFCGPRGTGKTSLARILAKAINCPNPSKDFEPCNTCDSCKEITSAHSLDVLEIDGASNRGIDEIRRVSESLSYTPAAGKYKIIIIDEVHMLTKEAFNALLKTLEEPPPHAKFFFATTEPQKVLPTVLSRCQRFNLNRIPIKAIEEKLKRIVADVPLSYDEGALRLIARVADGGMRDAESILDQLISFTSDSLTPDAVTDILGIMPSDRFFALDKAGKDGDLSLAFELAHEVFSEGKDIPYFVELLIQHFRTLLLIKLSGAQTKMLPLTDKERQRFQESSKNYRREQLLYILDILTEAQEQMRRNPAQRTALELALLKILRSHQRVPVDLLVDRLTSLEKKIRSTSSSQVPEETMKIKPKVAPLQKQKAPPMADGSPPPPPAPLKKPPLPKRVEPKKEKTAIATKTKTASPIIKPEKQSRYDTVLQFAAIELEGTINRS